MIPIDTTSYVIVLPLYKYYYFIILRLMFIS
jgi:hypothetical protein